MLLMVTLLMQQGCGWVRRRKLGGYNTSNARNTRTGRNAFKAMRVSAKGPAVGVWQQDRRDRHDQTHNAFAGWRFRLSSLTERLPASCKGIAMRESEPNTAQAYALRSAKFWTMFTARHSGGPRHQQQLQLERAAWSFRRGRLELGSQALQVALRDRLSLLWKAQMPQASCAFQPVLLSTCWLSGRDHSVAETQSGPFGEQSVKACAGGAG